jgi:hypothetical protein
MTGNRHYKEIEGARQFHGVVSDSRAVSSFSLDNGTVTTDVKKDDNEKGTTFYRDGRGGYVENKQAMKYKMEERVAPTDGFLYLRNGMARNVALDDIIRERETSEHFRCAIKSESFEADLPFMNRVASLGNKHGDPAFPCKSSPCRLKHDISVYFSDYGLDRVPGCIENLSKLEDIFLSNNQIKKIDGLDNLKKLERLHLGNNKIKEISGLDNLKGLRYLFLSGNEIEKIKGLDNLEKVRECVLTGNRIKSIEGISNMRRLEKLWLNDNLIEKVSDIKIPGESSLFLNVRNNKIPVEDCLETKRKLFKHKVLLMCS